MNGFEKSLHNKNDAARRIRDLLTGDTPQCVSIIGERRIGKSSLAWRVFHQVKKQKNTRAVFLDCDGLSQQCNSKEQFFQRLNQGFGEDNPAGEEPGKTLFQDYSTFKNFIGGNGRRGEKTIIFLDEFEHLPDKGFADDTFFSNLRSMANHPGNLLALVTISKTPLKELIHDAIQGSNFWNIFSNEIIGLLDHDSIMKLREKGFKRSQFSLSGEEIEEIHYYAGDFPFFNQIACGFLWETKAGKDALDWDNLEVAIFPHYEKLWKDRTKEEKKILKRLSSEDAEKPELKDMWTRGLVIKNQQCLNPFSGYFSHLLESTFKIPRKKISLKACIRYIIDLLYIRKAAKEALSGK